MDHRNDAADLLVIFGITGDLARKMTFRALYRLEQRGLLDFPVIGVASDAITTTELVKHAREATAKLYGHVHSLQEANAASVAAAAARGI